MNVPEFISAKVLRKQLKQRFRQNLPPIFRLPMSYRAFPVESTLPLQPFTFMTNSAKSQLP